MKVSLVVRLTLYLIWLFKDRWFTDARSGLYPLIGTGHAGRLGRDAGRLACTALALPANQRA
jgi:hypothetical protein